MRKIVFAALAMVFMAGGAQAQIVSSKNSRLTIERKKSVQSYADYNRLSFGLSTNKWKVSDKELFDFEDFGGKESLTLKGLDLNYLHGISLTQRIPLFLEVGGRLTFDTYKHEETEREKGYYKEVYKDRLNLLALSVPVNVTYKYAFSNGMYIAPFAGIHFRLNLLANDKWDYEQNFEGSYADRYDDESESGTVSFFKADDEDDEAYFDEDEDTFKRFQFGGQIGVNLGYKAFNLGFAYYFDTPLYNNDFKIKNGGISLTVGYNF